MPSHDSQPQPPDVQVSTSSLFTVDAPVVAVGFTRSGPASDDGSGGASTSRSGDGSGRDYVVAAPMVDALREVGVDPFEVLDRADAKASGGETVTHEVYGATPLQTVVLVGLGEQSGRDLRRAGAALGRLARKGGPLATSVAAHCDHESVDALVEGLVLGAFGFHRKSDTEAERTGAPLVVLSDLDRSATRRLRPVVDRAAARARASWRARAFALTPSNEKGPEQLAAWATESADRAGLAIDVWDEKRLARDGFGGILAVGRGSAYESRFVRLDYTPRKAGRRTPKVVLAGKGITFDSGGLSIKPRDAMASMKRDMTGAGVVIAVMGALRELDVPVSVTGLVASAENAVGGASMRPGDVITHYGGRTSEVGNTDAEGRLVLADALAYAVQNLEADALVDIATLTGAAKTALGTTLGALYANRDELAGGLLDAGEAAGEPVWRMPLQKEYEPLLENSVADATNAAGSPGSITAALYLQHFAGTVPWAHLDIASVGDSAKDAFEYTQGATGFGARLLLRWLGTYGRS